ncbi:hypothetical protein L0128_20810 [candidate division KSB1 bacterium]|nr:hypothetical protein [candidate division KSB1 bacterium]
MSPDGSQLEYSSQIEGAGNNRMIPALEGAPADIPPTLLSGAGTTAELKRYVY